MASLTQKPADPDLQCFQKRINLGSSGQGLSHCAMHGHSKNSDQTEYGKIFRLLGLFLALDVLYLIIVVYNHFILD